MKTRWMVALLLIAGLSMMAGCKKKEPVKAPAEPAAQEAPGMMDSMKKAADEAVQDTAEAVKETAVVAKDAVKEAFTADINLDKAVGDLKAEAAKMDVASLTALAMKYKDAIMEKQAALKPLTDKLAAIPMAEKMGTEAKGLMAEIKAMTDAIAPLNERLGVYVDAIKAKGGDISKLAM